MSEKPILFSGPMVRAILEGRKTQTRRVVDWKKLHKQARISYPTKCRLAWFKIIQDWGVDAGDGVLRQVSCPYGKAGDRLWVREAWHAYPVWTADDGMAEVGWPYREIPKEKPENCHLVYAADHGTDGPFRPSIHMPRWASRITLMIESVRVERLQDISEEDAIEEGIDWQGSDHDYAKIFRHLWDSINSKPGNGWESNPYVWVIEFSTTTTDNPESREP